MILTPPAPNPFLTCLACAAPIIGIVGEGAGAGGAAAVGGMGAGIAAGAAATGPIIGVIGVIGIGIAYAWKLHNESKDEPDPDSPAVPQPETDDLSPRQRATYDGATTKNNLHHIFGKEGHDLDPLVEKYGSEEAVVKEMVRGLEGKTPTDGEYIEEVNIGGKEVTVKGRVVNGIPRIGTAFIRPK